MAAPTAAVPALEAATFAPLVERIGASNPFTAERADRLATGLIDVPAINQAPFERIVKLARQACAEDRGIGAVLWGEAGTGKSHLLARLARWADEGTANASFVYLHNLSPNAEHLPRYVLKSTIAYLTRALTGAAHQTTLFRIVNAALREALKADGIASPGSWKTLEESYNRLVNRLGGADPTRAVLLDRDVYHVLFRFYRSAHRDGPRDDAALVSLAVRWLSGDPLDPADAGLLGLVPGRGAEEGVQLADDQRIKQVFIALTQLARSRNQPFLLCFDHVENLGADCVGAVARFLHDLIDSCGNLLVLTSGVKHDLLLFCDRNLIHSAAWDRVAQYKIEVPRIRREEARAILAARLQAHFAPHGPDSAAAGLLHPAPLFPLGSAWYDDRVRDVVDSVPRHVIQWARDRWEQQQTRLAAEPVEVWLKTWERFGPAPVPSPRPDAVDALVSERLREEAAHRHRDQHTLPPSAENLAGLTGALLEQCLARRAEYGLDALERPPALRKPQRPAYDFVVRRAAGPNGAAVRVGVLFIATASANSAGATLRRLVQAATAGNGPERLLLVTDERQPLHLGATGRGYLDQLAARGAPELEHLTLTFAEYADLDALKGVVGLARSGDLEIVAAPGESPVVREDEVIDSYHRHDRYRAHRLLDALLGKSVGPVDPKSDPKPLPPPPPSPVSPPEKDLREFLMAQLALKMGASTRELATCYADYRTRMKQPPLAEDACRAAVEQAARGLGAEGKLKATPGQDGLYLLRI